MNIKKLLYWTPRILAILFTCYVTFFAFYRIYFMLYKSGFEITNKLESIFYGLTPILALIIPTIIAWKKEFIGGCIFIALGFSIMIYLKTYQTIEQFLPTTFPLYLIGILFIINNKRSSGLCKKLPV